MRFCFANSHHNRFLKMTGIGLGFGRRKEFPKHITKLGTFLGERIHSKFRDGVVVSARLMQKTIMVAVCKARPHPKYRKWILTTSKLMVHDENQEADIGDRVRIMHSRTFSKHKHHRLSEILYKDPASREILRHPDQFNSVQRELYDHSVDAFPLKKGVLISKRIMEPRHRHPTWINPKDDLNQVSDSPENIIKGRLEKKLERKKK